MDNFRTYDLAVQLYQVCKKHSVPSFLRNQLDRASSSIVLNLAEGHREAIATYFLLINGKYFRLAIRRAILVSIN